jgi:hypothetical protein
MGKDLFRKSSLEQVSSPENLSAYIKITGPGVWGIVLGSLVLLAAVGIWLFTGNIPNTITANGIIFPESGVISAIPVSGGRINDMRVSVGDYVEEGQIIAVISQEEMVLQILDYRSQEDMTESGLENLLNAYERKAIIYAPVSGTVLYARQTNETVTNTEPVARIVKQEKYADNQQVVSYIPSDLAKRLSEGMSVQVSPSYAPREEYGFMYGNITYIGEYPVIEDDVIKTLGNAQYANDLLTSSNLVEVRMTLAVDGTTKNKMKWSNPKGETLSLGIGTYTDMQIVISNFKPYELIF